VVHVELSGCRGILLTCDGRLLKILFSQLPEPMVMDVGGQLGDQTYTYHLAPRKDRRVVALLKPASKLAHLAMKSHRVPCRWRVDVMDVAMELQLLLRNRSS